MTAIHDAVYDFACYHVAHLDRLYTFIKHHARITSVQKKHDLKRVRDLRTMLCEAHDLKYSDIIDMEIKLREGK